MHHFTYSKYFATSMWFFAHAAYHSQLQSNAYLDYCNIVYKRIANERIRRRYVALR